MSYDSQTATSLINKLRKDVDSLTLKIAVLTDSKASGTSGGTGTAAAWTARELNTVAIDPQGLILQLESNTFQLAAGSYQVRAIAAFHHTGLTRMRLYDVTNSVVIGYSVSTDVSNQADVYLDLTQNVTPHKNNVYRLEYYITASGAEHLGVPTSIASVNETYAICEITRLDTGATKPLGAGGLQGPQGPPGPTGPAGPPGPTGGGVTSINVSGGATGLTTSGGPVTGSGTITLAGVLNVANGGTGATTAAAALTSLGAYPASNPSGYTNNTGTVTSVSVTTANGVSGTVTNPTTTPAISLALGAITPTSVAASGSVTGSNLSGSNTGDQTITLTGDVTGSGTGSFAATIGANKVTYAKMQAASAVEKLIGSNASGTALTEITLGTNLSMSGSTLNAAVASGSVTSVNADGGTTGFSFTGGPVTSSGTLSMTGTLAVGSGGTGATSATNARTNLGLAIGTDIPALDGTGATGTWNIDVLGSAGTITSTLPVNKGGTGSTTAAGALTNLGAYAASNPAGYTSNAGTVTNVSASGGANITVTNGTTTPVISQNAASSTQNGYMTSTYAAKLDGITAGASVSSVGVSGGSTGMSFTGGPITTSGTVTMAGTLAIANGGTGLTSVGTQYKVLTSTGSAAIWDTVDLNSGTSNVLPISKGGTSSITAQSAINALAGSQTNGQYLRGNGTNVVMSAIQGVDLPLISLTSGVTGTLAVTNGGTGQTNSFTDGDLLIGNTTGGTLNKAKLTAGSGISITNGSGSITIAATGSGSGDVVGPSSSTSGTFAIFDGTTGKVIKEASWIQKAGDLFGPAGYNTMVDGFVYIPADTAAPTGTPTNVTGANVPMFFQTNNATNTNILWVHNGYAWKSVSLS
jgi:hypothetical protein